jgi:chorismate mutase/prephenate dehydratase
MNSGGLWCELEKIDRQLVDMLSARMDVVKRMGQESLEDRLQPNKSQADSILSAFGERAARSHRRLREICRSIAIAYDEVVAPATAVVYCLGPQGSFTHLAASRWFGGSADYKLLDDIPSVFEQAANDANAYCVVAVGNSVSGPYGGTLDLLSRHAGHVFSTVSGNTMGICAATRLTIDHSLIGSGEVGEIRSVCSHPQAFDQCGKSVEEFQQRHGLEQLTRIYAKSTADAARQAAANRSIAAIAHRLSARISGLRILQERIDDNPRSETMFFLLSRQQVQVDRLQRTFICFRCPDTHGALCNALSALAECEINITMLFARPIADEPWQFSFYAEIEGHAATQPVFDALTNMAKATQPYKVKVLGSYGIEQTLDEASNSNGGNSQCDRTTTDN